MSHHSRNYRLGDLQLKIMKVLWERPASVADVHQALGDSGLAYTTVATMLHKMEAHGLVHHREGRRFIYQSAVRPEAVTRSVANDVLERLKDGWPIWSAICWRRTK